MNLLILYLDVQSQEAETDVTKYVWHCLTYNGKLHL